MNVGALMEEEDVKVITKSYSIIDNNLAVSLSEPVDIEMKEETLQGRYGFRKWTPDGIQFLNNARWFLVFACVASLGQSMAVNGLIGLTISSVERRFGLSSSQSAWLMSSYEISGAPALLVVGYLGARAHKPKWIAGGLVICACGIFLYSLPHFIAGLYDFGSGKMDNICHLGRNFSAAVDACDTEQGQQKSGQNRYLVVFVIAGLLMGCGAVPLYVLVITYIDDSMSHTSASFYNGKSNLLIYPKILDVITTIRLFRIRQLLQMKGRYYLEYEMIVLRRISI